MIVNKTNLITFHLNYIIFEVNEINKNLSNYDLITFILVQLYCNFRHLISKFIINQNKHLVIKYKDNEFYTHLGVAIPAPLRRV